jgi:hypothetical protein
MESDFNKEFSHEHHPLWDAAAIEVQSYVAPKLKLFKDQMHFDQTMVCQPRKK